MAGREWLSGRQSEAAYGRYWRLRHDIAFSVGNVACDRHQRPRAYWASIAFTCVLLAGFVACDGWLLLRIIETGH
jgi:hypothetical protein